MRQNLLSIYNRLRKVSTKSVKSNNNIVPIYEYDIHNKSKKTEIIKGINEVIDYLNNPEYVHIHNNSFNKNFTQPSRSLSYVAYRKEDSNNHFHTVLKNRSKRSNWSS